jgi:formate dehydrogenase subunit gamma
VLKICRAEACQSMGAEKLFADVAAALGDSAHVTLEPVYCLGNCALSPSAMIDGKLLGRVDTARALAEVGK